MSVTSEDVSQESRGWLKEEGNEYDVLMKAWNILDMSVTEETSQESRGRLKEEASWNISDHVGHRGDVPGLRWAG